MVVVIECFWLSDLIIVMRESQIFSSCMNVNSVSKYLISHCGALNMPAWSALSPFRRPARFSWLWRFPEREIVFILLLSLLFLLRLFAEHTFSLFQHFFNIFFLEGLWHQFGILVPCLFFKLHHIEVNWSSLCFVGVSVVDDFLDKFLNLWHELRHTSEHVRWVDLQTLHISEEGAFPLLAEFSERDIKLVRPLDYFIVDICDVHAVLALVFLTLIS